MSFTIQKNRAEIFDVCVVGAGASGGVMAAWLARQGARVALVEGGPKHDTSQFNTHGMPYEYGNRRVPHFINGTAVGGERTRGLGGKSLLWNAVALRLSERDFKGYTREGVGYDWPIGYNDLAPYYDKIEEEVGVCGNPDHLEDLPDGRFLPPMPLKCVDYIVRNGAAKLGIPVVHVRKATLTSNKNRSGRAACHYCGNCMAGCDVAAKFNTFDVHLRSQAANRKLTLLPNRIAREVVVDDENRVTGVVTIDRLTRAEEMVHARAVVVSCACVQSVGLLLMSKSKRYPTGLANSSGRLGRDWIPHLLAFHTGVIESLRGSEPVNDEGALDHGYIPSWMHARKRDYARSFAVQYDYQGRRANAWWVKQLSGFGPDLKREARQNNPGILIFRPNLEMLPNAESYLELDPERKDAYGLPQVRQHLVPGENEWKMFRHSIEQTKEIFAASGIRLISAPQAPAGPDHQLGGCIMGDNPRRSVLNKWCQTHDIANLFVVDGSVFPSGSEKNPTLTIMALAARTADHIIGRLKRREL
jgi:choline dehydrogenase-like flavoprotein